MKLKAHVKKNMHWIQRTVMITLFLASLTTDIEGSVLTKSLFYAPFLVATLLAGGLLLWSATKKKPRPHIDEVTERRLEQSLMRLQSIQRNIR